MSVDYRGPATLLAGDREIEVEVTAAVRFEPTDGKFHWGGRIAPGAGTALIDLVRSGTRDTTLRIADGPPMPVRLGEPDPWGGLRVTGTGRPPWPS